MRKTSVHSQKHKRDGGNCAIVLVSWDKSEGGIEMNSMKQAFSPFGKIFNPIKVMQNQHDEIFGKSDQGSTYTNISVDIYEKIFNIGTTDMTAFFCKGKLLWVADCSVENDKKAGFEQVQRNIWNKGMTPGMLSGAIGKGQSGRYLAASLWDNEYSHQRYVDKELAALIREAGVIELHPKWAVI